MKKSTYIMGAMVALGALMILGVILTIRCFGEKGSNITTVTVACDDIEYSIPNFSKLSLAFNAKNLVDDNVYFGPRKMRLLIKSDSICEEPSLSIPSFLDGVLTTSVEGDSLAVTVACGSSIYRIEDGISPVITLRLPCDYDMSLINVRNVYVYTLEVKDVNAKSLTLKSNVIENLRVVNTECDSLVVKSFRDVKMSESKIGQLRCYNHSRYDENEVYIEVGDNCEISHAVLTGKGSFNIKGNIPYEVEPYTGETISVTTEYGK